MRYQKKAAILVLSIVCFLLTLASTVLGDPTPVTQVAAETQSNQPSTTEQASSKTEVPVMSARRDESGKIVQVEYKVTPDQLTGRPAVRNLPVPALETPSAPAQPEQTTSAQPAAPASDALSPVSTRTPSPAGVSTIPTEIPTPRVTTPAPAPKLTPTAPQKPVQVGVVTPSIPAPKPMPNNNTKIKPAPKPVVRPAPKPAPKPAKAAKSTKGSPGFIAKVISATKGLISRAVSWLGTRYVWGGLSAKGVDCSGLTKLLYQKEGINLPHLAKDQFKRGVAVARTALLPGDLVFFNTARGPLTHVGIYIGNGQFLHAANPRRGVRIDKLNSSYYTKHYAGARRLLNLG